MEVCEIEPEKTSSAVIIAKESTRMEAIRVANDIRQHVPVYVDIMKRNFKAQMSYANYLEASHSIIIGEKELEEGKLTLKDMNSGDQELLTIEEVIQKLTE